MEKYFLLETEAGVFSRSVILFPDQLIGMVNAYSKGMENPILSLPIKLIGKNKILPITGHFCPSRD